MGGDSYTHGNCTSNVAGLLSVVHSVSAADYKTQPDVPGDAGQKETDDEPSTPHS